MLHAADFSTFAYMMNVENMEYNTTRSYLTMREYGRHIQKMVDYLLTIEDKEKRQRNAMSLIELMGFLNPHLKNVEDFRHKLWDHLFLISDFKLDVESPYPIPTRETLKAKPEPLKYPKRYPKFNHLGKNIEIVIEIWQLVVSTHHDHPMQINLFLQKTDPQIISKINITAKIYSKILYLAIFSFGKKCLLLFYKFNNYVL